MDFIEKTQTDIEPKKSVNKQENTAKRQERNDNTPSRAHNTQEMAGNDQEQADKLQEKSENKQEKSQDSRANASDDPGKSDSDQEHSSSDEPGIPQTIESKFDYCKRCLSASSVVLHIWDIVLTTEDRASLGNDLETAFEANRGIVGIWMHLRNFSYPHAIIDLGRQANLITDMEHHRLLVEFEHVPSKQSLALSNAIASGDLVLIHHRPAAYWEGKPIDIDWQKYPALWNFFVELCNAAKKENSVDRLDFGDKAYSKVVTNLKSRLKEQKAFPQNLFDLIQSNGRGTQQLMLASNQIHFFAQFDEDELESE